MHSSKFTQSEMTAAIEETMRIHKVGRDKAVQLVTDHWSPEEIHDAFIRRCEALERPLEIQKKPYCTHVRPQNTAVADTIVASICPFLQLSNIEPAVSQQQFLCFMESKNFFARDTSTIDSGILCCDEQGGGKTFQALFALLHLWTVLDPTLVPGKHNVFKRSPCLRPMLVVASKMTLPTWMAEINRLDVPANLFVFIESSTSDAQRTRAFESAGVIVTTKTALSADYGAQGCIHHSSMAQFPGPQWECVVVDEVDSVCSDRVSYPPRRQDDGSWSPIDSKSKYKREFNALLWATHGCPRRLLMTGTPWLSNDPMGKICCIILLAWPLRAFQKTPVYAARIVPYRGAENVLATMLYQQRTDVVQWFQQHFVIGRTLNQVRAAMLRGPIVRQTVYYTVDCSPTEHEILKLLETRTARAINDALESDSDMANELARMEFITHLMRLRERTELNAQFAEMAHSYKHKSLPADLVASCPLSNKENALIAILKHVCKHPNRKALLYTDFVVTNVRITYLLQAHVPEMAAFMLTASMKPSARQDVINNFNSFRGNALFFSNIKCGERGINLQSADTTIFLSAQYNPSAEAQAMFRNARLSTEHERVTVIYLSMDNTIQGWISNIGADKLVRAMQIGHDDDLDDSVNRKRGLDGKLKTKQVVEMHKARQFAFDVLGFAGKRTPCEHPEPLQLTSL